MLKTRKTADSSQPLRVLSAAVMDTETTSLDVKTARIVEIGVAPMIDGRMERDASFSTYVNPGEAIPEQSRIIHGISDEMVKDAPGFEAAYKSYLDFAGDAVVLGYSLGFDLAVLKAEHERAGLPWKAPRSLDIRDLVRIINPPLPDFSLDKVAAWLGVDVRDRHTAVGDAVVTGEIFVALLPRLRDKGIRTLAEAEEACRRRRPPADEAPAGWHDVVSEQPAAGALARVDSYPYRHRVKDVMSSPPLTVDGHATLHQALDSIVEKKISSLFVPPARPDAPYGIITERDILRAIAADPLHALQQPVQSVATFPLTTVSSEDFLYSAFGRMRRKRYRHLGVADAEGKLVGALTQRDLLRQRADDAIALTDAMDEAAGVNALAAVWKKLADAARSLVAEEVDPRDVAAIISGEVCSLTARAAEIAEREMAEHRPAGLRYAVMVLGSGGRGESLLAMDQDNALIYEGEGEEWLAAMAGRMNAILDEVGVPFCKGGVMAKNAEWRKSSAEWRRHVSSWLTRSNPQDILNSDIFFDALPVHGDHALADSLRRDAIEAASKSTNFLKLMTMNAAASEPPLGWFGRLKVEEDGRMDLKRGGIMPVFAAARVLALKHRIADRATAARLEALRGVAGIPQRQVEQVLESHKIILGIILNQQLADIARGKPPSSRVDPKDVTPNDKDRLKWALEHVKSARDLLGDPPVT
ncbi:MAG: CBS domain-containing protein [Alphaproteobacteria bacterium]|nr:CBS domain-containing protein [Alphaproteobacteria bacterium]